MTKDEALRLALEALEFANVNHWWGSSNIEKAITAIKTALEAEDEPVACSMCNEWEKVCDQHLRYINKLKKKRTWVGLTDEDRFELAKAQHGWEDLCLAVEAKLKEKNSA